MLGTPDDLDVSESATINIDIIRISMTMTSIITLNIFFRHLLMQGISNHNKGIRFLINAYALNYSANAKLKLMLFVAPVIVVTLALLQSSS